VQPVVLDGWWLSDYAAQGCEPAAHCSAIRDSVFDFETQLTTSFATDTTCKGVRFVKYKGPGNYDPSVSDTMGQRHWMLIVDFVPGNLKQPWTMLHNPDLSRRTQGEGAPEDIAHKVCAIVSEQGGTLLN
jgi:hypothetical protein